MSDTWILIPNLNGMRWLPDCLATLSQTVSGRAKVLVVDNGSTDNSVSFIREKHPEIAVLALEQNLGFVHAMNVALLSAKRRGARNYVLLNNDTKLTPNWLDELLDSARANPQFGILGAYQLDFEGNVSPRTQAILNQQQLSNQATLPGLVSTDWVEGSCMLIQDWVLDKIGFLDPLYAPAYFEEIDFCRRAKRMGIDVGLVTRSQILHHGAGTSQNGPKRSRQRILSERNYLLYHAGGSGTGFPGPRLSLLGRAIRHGSKKIVTGELTVREWLAALTGLPRRLKALEAKVARDKAGRACPILGEHLPDSEDFRYATACIDQLSADDSASKE